MKPATLLQSELNNVLALLRSPGKFLDRVNQERVMFDALRTLGVVVGLATALMFLTSLLNLSGLKQAAIAMRTYTAVGQSPYAWMTDAVPWNRLLFPFLLFTMLFMGGLLRHMFVRVLGEKSATLAVTQSVGLYASVPLVLFMTLSGIVGNFFPVVPGPNTPASAGAQFSVVFSFFTLLGGFGYHAVVCIKALRRFYAQNMGRAVLSYVFPWVFVVGGTLVLYFSMFMLLMLAGAATGGAR